MARGVNKVILVGNLGADPETRSMPSGMTVTNIRIATSESWKDKTSGAQQERTEWHSIALFGRLGEIAAEYLRKGSQVFIEGKLRTRKWQDKQGNDRFTTEIVADNMQMLGGRGGGTGGGTGGSERGGSSAGAPPRDDYDQTPAPAGGKEDFDDDIPFSRRTAPASARRRSPEGNAQAQPGPPGSPKKIGPRRGRFRFGRQQPAGQCGDRGVI